MTDFFPFPHYNLCADSMSQILDNVEAAVNNRDYSQILQVTSEALLHIHETLVSMLDLRAYVLLMKGKFSEAIKDAENLISYEPVLATGYLRLGDLYQMQGKQQSAINMYDIGLRSASVDHPDYIRIINSKELAVQKDEKRIDFLANLPIEIVDDIITLLPTQSRCVYLQVSSIWRSKIFGCTNIWKNFSCGTVTEDDHLTSAAPYFAAHVEELIIDTRKRRALLHYLRAIKNGNFAKLRSLQLDINATRHINTSMIMPLSHALWRIQGTLTKLNLQLNENVAVIALADILSACCNLKTLNYSTLIPLSSVIGELMPLESHDALVDMELKAESIDRADLLRLLPNCQKVRRLVLFGCNPTVLDIADTICPNLENFGYNPVDVTVPALEYSSCRPCFPGLRRFYTKNGGDADPASQVFPLMRRNMESLIAIYVNISARHTQANLIDIYDDLKFPNLEKLVFWGDDSGIVQTILLQSIYTCTKLTRVEALCSRDIASVANRLRTLPQLKFLQLAHAKSTNGDQELAKLFQVYAKDTRSPQKLDTIWLRNCGSVVTDDVLNSLSSVPTLEDIWLVGPLSVSTKGSDNFFRKLRSSISELTLTEVDTITDLTLFAIATLKLSTLKTIRLAKLTSITDQGLKDLIDGLPNLQKITLTTCESITLKGINYLKKRVKSVASTE